MQISARRNPDGDEIGLPGLVIQGRFELQAAARPGQVAVRCGTDELTYDELNGRANQLAHLLHRLDVGPETLVALYLDRGPSMVVSILAVLKAGGAYVP